MGKDLLVSCPSITSLVDQSGSSSSYVVNPTLFFSKKPQNDTSTGGDHQSKLLEANARREITSLVLILPAARFKCQAMIEDDAMPTT